MSNRKTKFEPTTEPAIVGNTVLADTVLDTLATSIINELDSYARDYDCYEYGLPTDSVNLENQIAIVKALINSYR